MAELADAAELRSAVAASLFAAPSHVIATLTDLVHEAAVTPMCVREARPASNR